ncbi:urease accessory protein UreE [Cyanobium gracile]|uniref:Urease accessory protein UreE n=1 Tax=Cyanobium gracile UHCC 0281 TaxID=3110309 RepID=A0ABU5SW56_9CYAN|nr:urease accessory protein UreE [Cyanobium gracile]MEA5442723.1 urease accessory protein UreE [Cyanobium gracile UHCC 0281]
MVSDAIAPLVLVRHLPPGEGPGPDPQTLADPPLRLLLRADERTSLRGHRRSACGRDLLLQLPRGAALEPGDRLAPEAGGPVVVVAAAGEPLMVVRAGDPLALLQAAYHLGNRHVAMELHRDELRLGVDNVLEDLLRHRGLTVERTVGPFLPEPGAYEPAGHAHSHRHP